MRVNEYCKNQSGMSKYHLTVVLVFAGRDCPIAPTIGGNENEHPLPV